MDAFWAKATGTIEALHRNFWQQVTVGRKKGFEMFPTPIGPFPRRYDSGLRAAIAVLDKSMQPGRYGDRVAFSTARKQRTVHTKLCLASPTGALAPQLTSDRSSTALFYTPTNSEFFKLFMAGFKARVGERVKKDAAISIEVMIQLQRLCEKEWGQAEASGDLKLLRSAAENGAFLVFTFCGSMRGFETPKVVLDRLEKQMLTPQQAQEGSHATPPHVSLPLVGQFKARTRDVQKRIIDLAWETSSGLQPGLWATRLISALEKNGITQGWAFQNPYTKQPRTLSSFGGMFFGYLHDIQEEHPALISSEIDVLNDYGLARSCRRGATTRAQEAGVKQEDIEWMNRWNIGEDDVIKGPMRIEYAERKQMLRTFLRFSSAL